MTNTFDNREVQDSALNLAQGADSATADRKARDSAEADRKSRARRWERASAGLIASMVWRTRTRTACSSAPRLSRHRPSRPLRSPQLNP